MTIKNLRFIKDKLEITQEQQEEPLRKLGASEPEIRFWQALEKGESEGDIIFDARINTDNYNGVTDNIFPGLVSTNIVATPKDKTYGE